METWMDNFKYDLVVIDGIEYKKFKSGKMIKHIKARPNTAPEKPGIYMITDLNTGKKYIGSSSNLKKRMSAYLTHTIGKKQQLLKGIDPDKIHIDILETYEYASKEFLNTRELENIKSHNTIYPNGFNVKCPITNVFLSKYRPNIKKSSNPKIKPKIGCWDYKKKYKCGFVQIDIRDV